MEQRWNELPGDRGDNRIDLVRITDLPPLRIDGTVRRAGSLQESRDNPPPAVHLNARQIELLNVTEGDVVQLHAGNDMTRLPVTGDDRVPDGCVYLPAGFAETAMLGAAAAVRVVKAG